MAFWDFIDKIDLGDVVDVVGAAGTLATGLGKNRDLETTPQQGFGTLPTRIQEILMGSVLDRILAQGETPYEGRPMRRGTLTTDPNFDPVFGNYGIADLQSWINEQEAQQQPMPDNVQARVSAPSDIQALQEAVLRASTQPRWMGINKGQLNPEMIDYMKSKDKSVNPYGAGTVNYADWLAGQTGMMNSGAGGIFKQANPAYQAGFEQMAPSQYAATYDPESDLLGKALQIAKPFLVGAVLGPGAGAALSGLGLGTTAASLGSKALTSLANKGAR